MGLLVPINEGRDCAHFTMTTTFALPSAGIAAVPFNTVLHATVTYNKTSGTVGGIEAYHWKHSKTGFYKLDYFVRTGADVWNMISVCTNGNTSSPVGNSQRTGSNAGSFGYTASCVYKVTSVSDRFGLYHWTHSSAGAMSGHSGGDPASSFFITPQDGSKPTTGYYNDIIITPI